ncbi:MAG: sulfatase-like hydrolase/transferase [Eubacterium sp.]|nr:sulfatase-like hydrolase/transferase [Eubacterium sp.]
MFDFFRSGQKKTENVEPSVERRETAADTAEESMGARESAGEMLDLEEIRLNEEELQSEAEAQYEKQEVLLAEKHRNAGKNKNTHKETEGAKTTPERKVLGNTFVLCFIVAVLINLFTETIARQSQFPSGGFIYLVEQPLVFLANTLIIYATLTIAALFKRRVFAAAIVASVWILIAIANGVILLQRMTPFNMKDMTAFADGITLITNYFSVTQLIGLGVGFVAAVVIFTLLFIKGPKRKKVHRVRALIGIAASWAVMLAVVLGLIHIGVLSTFFGSLPYAYRDYGVPYCFTNTWLNTGIHKPAGYTEAKVKSLIPDEYLSANKTIELGDEDISTDDEDKPNILFLQLESFVDPMKFTHIAFNKDPIPYFRSLMKKYSSGSLTVPACGAGTANTECEFMTGLSMHFFGPGEYPFKSVLSDQPVESVARDLKSIGYAAHAIHDHRALFYNRNEVFANMGYDTFTSLEYMSDVQRTPKGWAKDMILTPQIMNALRSTKQKDYIYTISVQGHGQYPAEKLLADPDIIVTKAPSDAAKNKYEYFANEVHEMDNFVKQLTEQLSKYDEKVILVMYGDHIPALDITEENYDAKDLFQTQYVVWSNYEMEKKDQDIAAYQLSAEILDRAGIHVGTTTIYHQTHDHDKAGYLSGLKMLGYDMIYGKNYIYGGKNPFKASDMKLGVKDIVIDKVVEVGGKYYIKGKNFTEFSKISLDGKPLDTVYLSSSLLGLLQNVDPADASRMKVSQIDRNTSTIISTTE